MDTNTATRVDRRYVVGLVLLLTIAFALRLVLTLRGGQGFWTDENRYSSVLDAISSGNFQSVLKVIFSTADHLGFKALSVIPAYLQSKFGVGYAVATSFFSLFSTASIAWIWLIARRTGAEPREAFGAALTFACSNAMFYWSRHLIPYDVALFWGLACLYVAVGPKSSVGSSALAGLFGLLTFVTYNGYWTWVALVLTGHVVFVLPNWRAALLRGAAGLLSLLGGFCLLVGFAAALDANLIESYTNFAGTIIQGDFPDGHLVIWEYLWSAESAGLTVWISAALGLIAAQFGGLKPARRGWLWLGGVTAVVVVLIVGSNFFEAFMVYGRVVRQLVPFAALLTGYVIFGLRLEGRGIHPIRAGMTTTLILAAIWNFSTPIRQEFPLEFQRRSTSEIERLRNEAARAGRPEITSDRFKFTNTIFYWPYPTPVPEYPNSRELRVREHPLTYRPYLYEGFNRDQRNVFLKTDLRMRLLILE